MLTQDCRSAAEAKVRLQGTHISPECSGGIRIEYARNKFGESVRFVVQQPQFLLYYGRLRIALVIAKTVIFYSCRCYIMRKS